MAKRMLKFKFTVKDKDLGWRKYGLKQRKLDGMDVEIGLLDSAKPYPDGTSVIDVGMWNEFGTIHIPARSWLRSTWEEQGARVM